VNGASKISGVQREPTDNSDQIGREEGIKIRSDCVDSLEEQKRKKKGTNWPNKRDKKEGHQPRRRGTRWRDYEGLQKKTSWFVQCRLNSDKLDGFAFFFSLSLGRQMLQTSTSPVCPSFYGLMRVLADPYTEKHMLTACFPAINTNDASTEVFSCLTYR
jgi:hypothetical protein